MTENTVTLTFTIKEGEELQLLNGLSLTASFNKPGGGGGGAFTPASNPNTIGWFDAYGDSLTLNGTAVEGVNNQIDGSTVTLANTGANQFATGGTLNGLSAMSGADSARLEFANLPSTGIINYFIRGRANTSIGARLMMTDSGNTYLPIGQLNASNTDIFRIAGTDKPVGVSLLSDGEATQSITSRGTSYDAITTGSLFSVVGIDLTATPMSAVLLGGSQAGFNFGGDMRGVVVVTGSMSADAIAEMQAWCASEDGWTI